MTTKDILDRATNLADLQNSAYITFDDRRFSLNESYRDVYEYVTKGDDDYFVVQVTLDPATISIIDSNQFTIDLPSDFFRLRTAEWNDNGNWRDLQRCPLNIRGLYTGTPAYRLKDGKMWLMGVDSAVAGYSTIRINYYPAAATLTVPDSDLDYSALSVVPISMAYTGVNRTIIYTTGTDIRAYSYDNQTDYLLYSSAGVKDIGYMNGYVYFVKGGEVWRGASSLTGVMTPGAITATGAAVVNSTLMWGYVYWSTATQCFRCNPDGTGVSLRQNNTVNYVSSWGTDVPYYGKISAANVLTIDGSLSTGLVVSQIAGDNTYLYCRTSADGKVWRIMPTLVAGVFTQFLLYENVNYMGVYGDGRLPVYTTDGKIKAISVYPAVTLTFPQNVAYEIMAYQCAMDFKRKNGADFTALAARREELWNRFTSQVHADDAKPERIQNAYWNTYSPWR